MAAPASTLNSSFFNFFSSSTTNNPKSIPAYATEFHRLREEFVGDVGVFVEKYPLSVAVYVVVSFIFGFTYFFTISPFNILNGIFHFSLGVSLIWSVLNHQPLDFIKRVNRSFREVTAKVEVKKKEQWS